MQPSPDANRALRRSQASRGCDAIPTGRATTVARPRRAAAPAPPAGRSGRAPRRWPPCGPPRRRGPPRASGRPSARAGARRPRRSGAGRGRARRWRPARLRGPSASPTATARLRRTTGLSASRTSSSYHSTIWTQSVSSAVRASACRAAIAACAWYCPSRSRASAACRRPTPSAISAGSHVARSCSPSGTRRPSGPVREARRAWCSSISASRPDTSGSSASAASCRVIRIASAARSTSPP